MYSIYKISEKEFLCEVTIQDGKERWHESSLQEAVKSVKSGALVYNHVKIKKKDIKFYEKITVTKVVEEWVQQPLPKV